MKEIHFGQVLVKWLNLHHLARQRKSLGGEDFLL